MPAKKEFTTLKQKYADLIAKPQDNYEIIPTDSVSLNLSIGVGGIPTGRFTEIFGSEGVGKTTLALSIVKNAIESGKRVLYVEPENNLSLDFVERVFGYSPDDDNFILIQSSVAEDALSICEDGVREAYEVIILDSIGALVPSKVAEKELTDRTVALLSHYITLFTQRNATLVNKNNIAMIFLNQVRDDFSPTMFKSYATPGGHAIKHMSALRISLSRDEKITAGDEVIGAYTRFNIVKNKLAPPFRSFRFPIMFDAEKKIPKINTGLDVLNIAVALNIIEQKRGYFYFDGNLVGYGAMKAAEELNNNKELLDKITNMLYNTINQTEKGGNDE